MYNPVPPAPPKKGLSKGLKIAIVILLVVAVGFVGLVAIGIGGYFYFTRRAQEIVSSDDSPAEPSGLTGSSSSDSSSSDSSSSDSDSSSTDSSSSSADDESEEPEPTAAQITAVAGGQSAEWEQQEISWTVPQRWGKQSADATSFLWRSPGSWDAASLIGSVAPVGAAIPVEISLNAFYEQALERKASGEVNEVRWLRIDGVKGVMFREAAPEDPESPQRLQWLAYREYKGQHQMVNIMLASRGKDFARHEDALYGILYSMTLGK